MPYGAFLVDPSTSEAVEEGGGNATTATVTTAVMSDVTMEGVRGREGGGQGVRWNATRTAAENSARRPGGSADAAAGGNVLADNKDTFSAGGRDLVGVETKLAT